MVDPINGSGWSWQRNRCLDTLLELMMRPTGLQHVLDVVAPEHETQHAGRHGVDIGVTQNQTRARQSAVRITT